MIVVAILIALLVICFLIGMMILAGGTLYNIIRWNKRQHEK